MRGGPHPACGRETGGAVGGGRLAGGEPGRGYLLGPVRAQHVVREVLAKRQRRVQRRHLGRPICAGCATRLGGSGGGRCGGPVGDQCVQA